MDGQRGANPVSIPFVLVGTALVAGIAAGAMTNAINVAVSPEYFEAVLGLAEIDVKREAIRQGMLEGMGLGVFFAIVFSISIAGSTRFRSGIAWPLRMVWQSILIVLLSWVVGGVCGGGLSWAAPTFFRSQFIGVPVGFSSELRYAWVGGTIWGAYGGTIIAAVWGCVVLHLRWKAHLAEAGEEKRFEVLPVGHKGVALGSQNDSQSEG